ncbi:hypothetical protein ES705_26160 [subsurface metagenome]
MLIQHNQKKKAERIFVNAKNIRVYTLDNHFTGKPANVLGYDGKNWMLHEWQTFNFSRLTEEKPGKYCLYVHSNCWYDFEN